jgi:hypothetical protein
MNMKFSCKHGIGAGLVLALLAVSAVAMAPYSPAHANAACDKLRTEFSSKLRPRILRLAKKHFHWSNWYHATLKRQQGSSKHPSTGDLSQTYSLMVDYCGSSGSCKAFAKDMNAASLAIYNVNKRWSAAGCPGQLDS